LKFSLFSLFDWPRNRNQSRAFEHELEPLGRAEAQGFDGVWLAEDRATQRGPGPSVQLAAAHLAARSEKIRIGTAMTILPFMHPLRVAEEVAMLDILCDGRIDWAVGRGIENAEQDTIFHEQLDVIEKAWSGQTFDHEGLHYRFGEIRCYPTPVQDAGPTIHIAATASETIEWAARRGHAIFEDAFSPVNRLARHRVLYRSLGAEEPANQAPTLRHLYVGKSARQARDEAGPALLQSFRARSWSKGNESRSAGEDNRHFDLFREEGIDPDQGEDALVAYLLEACAIVGDAVACRERIAELRETLGLSHLVAWQNFGDLDPDQILASQERLIEKVAPAFV